MDDLDVRHADHLASRTGWPQPTFSGIDMPIIAGGQYVGMLFGEEHVRRYQETDGAEGYEWRNGTPILLLTTTGRP